MDIVEFCEKVLNIQLLDFQKKFLRDMYEAGKSNQQFIFMPSRKHSRESIRVIIDKFIRKQECLKEVDTMSNDISTMYTKDRNMKTGRKGYGLWRNEKETAIAPAAYGDFVMQRRKRGKKR